MWIGSPFLRVNSLVQNSIHPIKSVKVVIILMMNEYFVIQNLNKVILSKYLISLVNLNVFPDEERAKMLSLNISSIFAF